MMILHAVLMDDGSSLSLFSELPSPMPFETVSVAGLCAIVSGAGEDSDGLFADEKRVTDLALRHNELLVQLAAETDLVPVRLGSLYSGVDAVRAHLITQQSRYTKLLAHLSNAIEVSIELKASQSPEKVETSDITSGRAWLAARGAKRNAVRDMAAARMASWSVVADAVSGLVRGHQADSRGRTQMALLVDRDRIAELERSVSLLSRQTARHGLSVTLTGPWPAYSFVGEAA
ncbi:MAG: GvpL/GvpF family gas vesicle protein [Pseudomonadota bacterium]